MPGDVAGPRVEAARRHGRGVCGVGMRGLGDRVNGGMSVSPGSGLGILFLCGIGVCGLVKMKLRIYERGKRRIKDQGKQVKK